MRDIKELKRLAILKWEWIVKHPKRVERVSLYIPELILEKANCSFCTEYLDDCCVGCPVKIGKSVCINSSHPYYEFVYSTIQTKANAQRVLDLIKAIPEA